MPIDRTARHFIYLTSQARVVIIIIYWAPAVCQKLWLKSPFGFYYQQHFTYLVNKIQRGKYLCWCHTDGYLVSSLFDIFLDLKHFGDFWWSSCWDSALQLHGVWVLFLVMELRSYTSHVAKQTNKQNIILKQLIFFCPFPTFSLSSPLSHVHCPYIWVSSSGIVHIYVTLILLKQQVHLLKFLLGTELIQSWKL